MTDNYPDNMDWGAYDDYHDPKLLCGHHSSDGCGCWCESYAGDGNQHTIDECNPDNCLDYRCKECQDVPVDYDTDLCPECQEYMDEVSA